MLSNLSVRIREFVYASGHRSPVRAFALHPALRVEPGAQLVLRNVSIIQDRFPAGFASDLCATWNHSATTVLDALGTLRVLGQQGTDTGLLLWNTSIFSANTTAAGAAMPCHAVVVGSEAQLQDTFTTSLIPRKRLYISLTRSMALSSANWVPISMPDETPVALLGDPGRATEIDFGGMLAFLIMADGFSMVGGITMSDLTLVNMVSWDAPVSMSSALVSFVPPIFVRRQVCRKRNLLTP